MPCSRLSRRKQRLVVVCSGEEELPARWPSSRVHRVRKPFNLARSEERSPTKYFVARCGPRGFQGSTLSDP